MADESDALHIDPIVNAIDTALSGGAGAVHFWDMNHSSPIPRQIFAHPDVLAAVAAHGTPVYVVEAVGAPPELFTRHNAGDREATEALRELFRSGGAQYQPDPQAAAEYSASYLAMLGATYNGQPVPIISPDSRGLSSLTPQESAFASGVVQNIGSLSPECRNIATPSIAAGMPEEVRDDFLSAMDRFSTIARDSGRLESGALDADIAKNTSAALAGIPNAIPITIYGAGHYAKSTDLDEHLPGVPIAIYNEAGAAAIGRLGTDNPDYMFYPETGVLEAMPSATSAGVDTVDTGIASAAQTRAPIPAITPEIAVRCRAEGTVIAQNILSGEGLPEELRQYLPNTQNEVQPVAGMRR